MVRARFSTCPPHAFACSPTNDAPVTLRPPNELGFAGAAVARTYAWGVAAGGFLWDPILRSLCLPCDCYPAAVTSPGAAQQKSGADTLPAPPA